MSVETVVEEDTDGVVDEETSRLLVWDFEATELELEDGLESISCVGSLRSSARDAM